MRILVTGGGGFLGRHLVRQLLARGEKVRIFSRNRYPELELLGVESLQGDLRNPKDVLLACSGQDAVFHTASLPGISVWRRPYFETNVLGTRNIIQGCLKAGVSKLIYTSSPSATDGGRPLCGVDESIPYPKKFLAWYSETKSIAEREVLAANGTLWHVHDELGTTREGILLTCALRPHLIWGPGDRHLIPRLFSRAQFGRLVQVGDGNNIVDVIYVDNAAKAHLLACDALAEGSPVAGSAYYLSQGKPVSCWGWIDQLLHLANLPPVTKKISFRTAWYAGAFLETCYKLSGRTTEPIMTRFLATQLAQSYWFNIARARNDLGYVPWVSTEEGMDRLKDSIKRKE